jgi:hypothetical protein
MIIDAQDLPAAGEFTLSFAFGDFDLFGLHHLLSDGDTSGTNFF